MQRVYFPKKCEPNDIISFRVDDDTCSTSTDCTEGGREEIHVSFSDNESSASSVPDGDSADQVDAQARGCQLLFGVTWLIGMLGHPFPASPLHSSALPPCLDTDDAAAIYHRQPTLREIHVANMRNRRLKSVASVSLDEVEKWRTRVVDRAPWTSPMEPGESCSVEDECTAPTMRELHAANTRNRRISLVAALSPDDLRAWQAAHSRDSRRAEVAEESTTDEFDSVSLRQLHEASTRKRRLGIVAALSPDDLRAWQEDRRREIEQTKA